MDADLVDVKQLFSNMMKRVQPWILSHFIMWLDLKVAEYKVLGYMVLDKKSVYDKDQLMPFNAVNKTNTPSPASVSSTEHMYILPTTTGRGESPITSSHQNHSPKIRKENKEYEHFAELVQNNKRKSISTAGTFIPEMSNVHKLTSKVFIKTDSSKPSSTDSSTENGDSMLISYRKPRKPGKVLHSIVNSLKQNCKVVPGDSEVTMVTGNQSDGQVQLSSKSLLDKAIDSEYSMMENTEKNSEIFYDSAPSNMQIDNMTSQPSSKQDLYASRQSESGSYVLPRVNREPQTQEMSEFDEDHTPLYKSQQFSSLISLSRSRGRRRRSSNDEITYPLITTKDTEVTQTYDEEPKSLNLADFYFAQNQLDEQFAVRRDAVRKAKQNLNVNKIVGKTSDDNNSANSICSVENGQFNNQIPKSKHENESSNQMSTDKIFIKQELEPLDNDEPQQNEARLSTDYNENLHNDNSNHVNNDTSSENSNRVEKNEFVRIKSEPQNDSEYFSSMTTGNYDRLSNQSFSSEGDTSSYHDNSQQFEYQGEDIAGDSYILNNSELYGEDYVGNMPIGTPGTDHHDNKINRQRSYMIKRKQSTSFSSEVPRDPTSGKFVCELCGGTFTNRSSYFRHKRIHGEKKYRCFLCDKAFHRKEHLQSHIHRHTKSFPLKCCKCNFESHSLDEATAHFQSNHNQDMKESP